MVGEIQERDGKLARYLSEFLGTFLLVFTVGCNVLAGDATWAVTSIACVYMVSIYALGDVSGAHFNPAVSLSLGISRKLQFPEMGIYIIIQLVAGLVAALCYSFFFSKVFFLTPGKDYTWLEASIAELIYTAMLCFVVLNVAASNAHGGKNQFYGLAIGFVIVAGGYAGGHISGGCFNPAVAWGIDLSSAGMSAFWCLPYTVFELMGSGLAAGLFRIIRREDFGEEPERAGRLDSKLISEFLGTFLLVLTIGLNVLGGSAAPVFSIAAALMCMIFALGSCSGAHFNPAVTAAIVISRRGLISYKHAGAYVVAQLAGGVSAGFLYVMLEDGQSFPLGPGPGFSWFGVAVAEIIFTFVLCFVVLAVATTKMPLTEFFGLAIGSCITAGGYAIGAVSGASLNPAVSLGISSSHIAGGGKFWPCIVYTIFELIGGAVAAGAFMATHRSEYKKTEELSA
eukprot:gnl/TRDRNA2_/TRDRNA2_174230_c4_seq1.p1 gnl/TRDRNA2_/TRDRNA2_174230_c4~~gnl/TRDRNA2_/TRDRNA2_174230_c4_seq1.p1  ORF type:complete len:454 (-),score=75.77 gnl/TRDRNA2_/TRDRNA2_174230_c4_seq1:65-1426(-)